MNPDGMAESPRNELSIGSLAARTGVSARLLRYYEEQGLLSPNRSTGGQRVYVPADERSVHQIRELLQAGFCSSVIRELLLPLTCPAESEGLLRNAFSSARARLCSERAAIDAELSMLSALESRLGIALHMHVRPESESHDIPNEHSATAPLDHRDRRLR